MASPFKVKRWGLLMIHDKVIVFCINHLLKYTAHTSYLHVNIQYVFYYLANLSSMGWLKLIYWIWIDGG